MPRKPTSAQKQHMSRSDWLAHALEILKKEGGSVLTIEILAKRLGVSRGSFYWHFKDRTDFVRQIVEHWSLIFTQGVAGDTDGIQTSAQEKLLALMEQIVGEQLNRYDIAIRAWASHDPVASDMVKEVDDFRLRYVRSLFAEMGFVGEDLEMRTRTMVVYYSLEPGLFSAISRKEQLKQLKLRHTFLIRS